MHTYEKHILFPIWNATTNFKKGCSEEYYGNVRYHGPIMGMEYKQSIRFYLHATDLNNNLREETFVVKYDETSKLVTCYSHGTYIDPPSEDYIIIIIMAVTISNR